MKLLFSITVLLQSLCIYAQPYSAQIRPYNGAPTIFIDDQPYYVDAFRCWPLKEDAQAKTIKALNKAGVKIFFVPLKLGKIWNAPNHYNYEEIDKEVNNYLGYAPAAWIIPIFGIHHDMRWWDEANLAERTIDGMVPNDTRPVQPPYACMSFASEKFKIESAEAIKKIIKYIESKPYINNTIGYQIYYGAYNEWIPWGINLRKYIDFNPQFINKFRIWLKDKYTNDAVLQKNWNNSTATFENAMPYLSKSLKDQAPDSGRFIDPAKKKQLLDSREFLSEIVTDTALYYAKNIKVVTNNKALVGMYSGANYQYQNFIRILKSPDIDFICSSTGYGDRGANGVTYDQGFILESIKLHNKIYLHDADIRTYLFPVEKQLHFGNYTDFGRLNSPIDTIMCMRREWGAMLVHGFGICYLNIHTSPVFYSPIIMRDIHRMDRAGKASLAFDRNSISEIAIIARQRVSHYGSFYYQDDIRSQLYRIGTPVDIYGLDDISLIKQKKYKLIVVLLSQLLTEKERIEINQLKTNGTTFIWSYASGYLGESGFSVNAMQQLTGFKFKMAMINLPSMILSKYPFKRLTPSSRFSVVGMGYGELGSMLFELEAEPDMQILGRNAQTNNAVFASKKFASWTSVYYPGYIVPSSIIREIALQAGVHIYCNSDNGLYVNKNFLIMSSGETDVKQKVELPEISDVYDIFSEKTIGKNIKSFVAEIRSKSTKAYFIGNQAEVELFKKRYLDESTSVRNWTWTKVPNSSFSLNYVNNKRLINIERGESKTLQFRISSNADNLKVNLGVVFPEAWKASYQKNFSLSEGEIKYFPLSLTVPPDAELKKYHISISGIMEETKNEILLEIQVSDFTYLSDLPWNEALSAWKSVNPDLAVSAEPITLNGKVYQKGIGSHANSKVVYQMNGKWKYLTGTVGMDDCAGKGGKNRASGIFEIWGNDRCLFKSKLLVGRETPETFKVDIFGVKILKLITLDGGDGNAADHTDWADLKLFKE